MGARRSELLFKKIFQKCRMVYLIDVARRLKFAAI